MKYGHNIETLFLIIDSEFNQKNFAPLINWHLEIPCGANHREIPAKDILSEADFIDLEYVDKRADSLHFDAVRLAVNPSGTVNYLLAQGGIIQKTAPLATMIGFFDGLEYRANETLLGTLIGRLPFASRETVTSDALNGKPVLTQHMAQFERELTEQSDNDNPYDNNNRGEGSAVVRTPKPKQPSGPSNAAKVLNAVARF